MKLPKPTKFAMPHAPVGESARIAAALFPAPAGYAYHAPAIDKPGNPRMERPHGGKGPRNVMER